jgi:hypothetical protein
LEVRTLMEVTENTAAEQIKAAERLLRESLARQLATSHGADWENRLSKRIRTSLEAVRDKEHHARPHAIDESNLLGYAGFDHLKAVVIDHWSCCISKLGLWAPLEYAKMELDRLHAVRNPAQHGRTLFPHEYVEGEGIARRLRFDIERQRRKAASVADEYWLYVEEAEDSLGNRTINNPESGSHALVSGAQPILLGDTLTLRVSAFDPWGRKMQYRLVDRSLSPSPSFQTPWQDLPEFEWTATVVGRAMAVDIEIRAEGEPHADQTYAFDSFATFKYQVRPAHLPSRPASQTNPPTG